MKRYGHYNIDKQGDFMKKIIILTIILTLYPACGACPINGDACIAEFPPIQLESTPSNINPPKMPKPFTSVTSDIDLSREIKPAKARNFRSNNTEYGYNSSCQFGVCMDTGTPKNFPNEDPGK